MPNQTLSESLLALAVHLSDKADIETAAAQDHLRNGEKELARIRARRHDNAIFYVGVCRDAAAKLTAKAKHAGFVPPTLNEVHGFCSEHLSEWPSIDQKKWFHHFESCGWKIGKGKQMVDWKAAARNGYANWKEANPKAGTGVKKHEDPAGWSGFLVIHNYPYCAHWSTDDAKRLEFSRWKGGK